MQRVFTTVLRSMLSKTQEEMRKEEHFNATRFQFHGDFCSVRQFKVAFKNVVQAYSRI